MSSSQHSSSPTFRNPATRPAVQVVTGASRKTPPEVPNQPRGIQPKTSGSRRSTRRLRYLCRWPDSCPYHEIVRWTERLWLRTLEPLKSVHAKVKFEISACTAMSRPIRCRSRRTLGPAWDCRQVDMGVELQAGAPVSKALTIRRRGLGGPQPFESNLVRLGRLDRVSLDRRPFRERIGCWPVRRQVPVTNRAVPTRAQTTHAT